MTKAKGSKEGVQGKPERSLRKSPQAGLSRSSAILFGLMMASAAHASFTEDLMKTEVEGSRPMPLVTAQHLGSTNSQETLSVTLVLRRSNEQEFNSLLSSIESGQAMVNSISRETLQARYGAADEDLALVEQFAQTYGLNVESAQPEARTVKLSGSAEAINQAFSVRLHNFQQGERVVHSHAEAAKVPVNLTGVVQAVVGLDNRTVFRPHMRNMNGGKKPKPTGGGTGPTLLSSFLPSQVAKLYNFPAGDGRGECIAILELGGGYAFSDLQKFFASEGLAVPHITDVLVDGSKNDYNNPKSGGADGEVELDIEIASAVAPAANVVMYFGPATGQGFLDTISAAVHDTKNRCGVLSISWGGPENSMTAAELQGMDAALADAAAAGMTVFAAAGDGGSVDGTSSDVTDFPASSPHVVACGGTTLNATASAIQSETVWNLLSTGNGATGGGISAAFKPAPAWQKGLKATTASASLALTGRGVPDVAGNAAPTTGFSVVYDGQSGVVGGTSAVSPLYAGLFTVINANKGSRVGFINPTLYANPKAFRPITSGNNGTYMAAKGWSAATGLGSPNGTAIQALFVK